MDDGDCASRASYKMITSYLLQIFYLLTEEFYAIVEKKEKNNNVAEYFTGLVGKYR